MLINCASSWKHTSVNSATIPLETAPAIDQTTYVNCQELLPQIGWDSTRQPVRFSNQSETRNHFVLQVVRMVSFPKKFFVELRTMIRRSRPRSPVLYTPPTPRHPVGWWSAVHYCLHARHWGGMPVFWAILLCRHRARTPCMA